MHVINGWESVEEFFELQQVPSEDKGVFRSWYSYYCVNCQLAKKMMVIPAFPTLGCFCLLFHPTGYQLEELGTPHLQKCCQLLLLLVPVLLQGF